LAAINASDANGVERTPEQRATIKAEQAAAQARNDAAANSVLNQ
jgi:hypothetical protein